MESISFLPCLSLSATDRFYSSSLGLSLTLDQGSCRIYRVNEAAFWGFCEHLEPLSNPHSVILTIVADDVEGWFARLSSLGVEVDGEPRTNEKFGIFHFFAKDPNGYRVEIQRFSDRDWKVSRIRL
jgi:catechol 2,3-dioxygenase-like lactoylglutathione lyase family enzyme